jgi:predicted HTH domain antitoxin
MHTSSLTQALTLYRSGTLTLAQAAARAGRSEAEFRAAMDRHGVPARSERPTVDARADRSVGAD